MTFLLSQEPSAVHEFVGPFREIARAALPPKTKAPKLLKQQLDRAKKMGVKLPKKVANGDPHVIKAWLDQAKVKDQAKKKTADAVAKAKKLGLKVPATVKGEGAGAIEAFIKDQVAQKKNVVARKNGAARKTQADSEAPKIAASALKKLIGESQAASDEEKAGFRKGVLETFIGKASQVAQELRIGQQKAAGKSPLSFWKFQEAFGTTLQHHHLFSGDYPLKGEIVEAVLVHALQSAGVPAKRSTVYGDSADITINGKTYEVKSSTRLPASSKRIPAFRLMRIGDTGWGNDPKLFEKTLRKTLKARFSEVTGTLLLGKLDAEGEMTNRYELVEIPRAVFMKALGTSKTVTFALGSTKVRGKDCGGTITVKSGGKRLFYLKVSTSNSRQIDVYDLDKAACKVRSIWEFPKLGAIS